MNPSETSPAPGCELINNPWVIPGSFSVQLTVVDSDFPEDNVSISHTATRTSFKRSVDELFSGQFAFGRDRCFWGLAPVFQAPEGGAYGFFGPGVTEFDLGSTSDASGTLRLSLGLSTVSAVGALIKLAATHTFYGAETNFIQGTLLRWAGMIAQGPFVVEYTSGTKTITFTFEIGG